MWRALLFISGMFITSWGLVFNLMSLAYLNMGYDLLTYFPLVLTKFETYFTLIGIVLILIATRKKHH